MSFYQREFLVARKKLESGRMRPEFIIAEATLGESGHVSLGWWGELSLDDRNQRLLVAEAQGYDLVWLKKQSVGWGIVSQWDEWCEWWAATHTTYAPGMSG